MDPVDDVQKYQRFQQISLLFKSALKGQVLLRGQDGFQDKTALFNAAARNHSWIVVSPETTQEVVSVVNICRENNLSPSVRSGGFATAGWARHGDVMVNLSSMNQVELRVPSSAELALYSRDRSSISHTEAGSNSRRKVSEAFPTNGEGSSDGRKKTSPISPSNDAALLNASNPSSIFTTTPRPGLERANQWNSQSVSSPIIQDAAEETSTKAEDSEMNLDAEALPKLPRTVTTESGIEADVESGGESNSEGTPSDSNSISNRSKSMASNSLSGQHVSKSLSTNSNSGSNGLTSDSSKSGARSSFKKTHNQTSNWVDRLSVPSPGGSWNEGEDTPATDIASGVESNDQEKSGLTTSVDSGWEDPNRNSRQESGSSNDSNPRLNLPSEISPPTASSNASSSSSHRRPLYEHERWKRHHRPLADQASTSKITLPTSGGFIWRSGEGGEGASVISVDTPFTTDQAEGSSSSSSSQFPPSLAFQGLQPMHPLAGLNGSNQDTLSGLQSAWPDYISSIQDYRTLLGPSTSNSNSTNSNPALSTSRISPPAGSSALYNGSSYASPSPIPPGMYSQRFALTSFGPGCTVRMIDAFTEKAGRESNFSLPSGKTNERTLAGKVSKGKGKQVEFIDDGREQPCLESDYNNVEEEQNRFGQVARGAPYHCPMSAYPVGSGSILTGGFGYLTRSYGLSLDNVVEVEMVLADGRVVTLNEASRSRSQEEADLWWAVRGAAPCFGIATRITCKAYPVPSVYSGNLIFPFNPATAGSLICHWRDCLKSGAPRELYSNLILTAGPDAASHVVVIQICFLGSKNEGDPFVHALSSWSGERVLLKDVEERSFLSQQDGVASVLKESLGRRWMIRGDLVSTLTDEFIAKSVLRFRALGIRAVWLFELVGGAIEDLDDTETSLGSTQRSAKFTIAALQQWHETEEDPRCIESVDRWMMEDVSKVSTGGPYPCFLERNEPLNRIAASFGKESFQRLRRIKNQVDPNGMFRHTFGKGLVFDEEEQAALSSM